MFLPVSLCLSLAVSTQSSVRGVVRRGVLRFSLVLGFSALSAHAAGEWQLPEASLRYRLELGRKPTHPTAGYYVHLPDGGILRSGTPGTVVMTEDGTVVPSYLLWNNPESGFSLVFADPGSQARAVYVYAQYGRAPVTWKPESGLTPSSILCAFPGRDNLASAQALGKLGRVEASVHASNDAPFNKAPFSIGGDNIGRPLPGVFYLLSYIEAPIAGKYWFSPFIRTGEGEVLIDGIKLNPKEQSKLWGGNGAFMELTKGLHRVEVYQTAPGTGPYPTTMKEAGLMFLTWRPPNEQLKSVDARVLKTTEIARSGDCKLVSVEAKDGSPVACAVAIPGLCYWFDDEEPLLIYELRALSAGQPADTTWTWNFPERATGEGARIHWIFPGFREAKIKLTAKSGQRSSTCVIPFVGFSTQKTSLEKPEHREAFRAALAGMLEVFPRNPDPISEWSEAWWNNMLRTVEGGEGYDVLLQLFTNHFEAARRKLAPSQLYVLEDLFLDLVQGKNPSEALSWLQKFQAGAPTLARQSELKLHEGELQMYYLGDRKQAEAIFTSLATLANELGERAKIRLGDLAFLVGELNKATAFYADVQSRARIRRKAATPAPGGLVTNQLVQGSPAPDAAPDWRSSPLALQNAAKSPGASLKGGALQEVSLSENVHQLADDGFLLEARQTLSTWETEFPLSKISGDYIIRESDVFIKSKDWKRARPMLEAYCREVDASSFLPDAASMLIACVHGAKEPPASIREIIEKVRDRLKYHPVASELNKFLATAK